MTEEEQIQIVKTVSSKIQGEIGKESFSQVYFDLEKSNPMLLKMAEAKAEDVTIYLAVLKGAILTTLNVGSEEDRNKFVEAVLIIRWNLFLDEVRANPNKAVASVNEYFKKNNLLYKVDQATLDSFCSEVHKIRKIEQTTRIFEMLQWRQEIMLCFGYAPRYLKMDINAINIEMQELDACLTDSKIALIKPEDAKEIIIATLVKVGHPIDTVIDKEIGDLFDILSVQNFACQAILTLKQSNNGGKPITSNVALDMIANAVVNYKEWQNSD